MAIALEIPGRRPLKLEHLVCDLNGTLTDRGELLPGIEVQIAALKTRLHVHPLSADTYGTATGVAAQLGVGLEIVRHGIAKHRALERLGARSCAAIGNGTNDRPMLHAAALAIIVLGPEGTSLAALAVADVLCRSTGEALALLQDPRALTATLRT